MKKSIVVLLVLITSAIFSLNHIIGLMKFGGNYSFFETLRIDAVNVEETYTYAPRVEELLTKKQIVVHDSYIYENRNKPSPFIGETFPAYILLFLTKITGSVKNAFISSDIIFPAAIFFIIFLFVNRICNNFLGSLAAASVTIFCRDILLVLPYPRAVIDYLFFINKPTELLPFARSFHPQVSFLLFLLYAIVMSLAIQKKQIKYACVSGILLGVLFYTYLFYWTTALISLFMLTFMFFLKKDNHLVKQLIVTIIIAGFIGSYYFFSMYAFNKLPEAKSFVEKSSNLRNYLFFVPALRFAIFAVFVAVFKKKKKSHDYVFLILIVAAVILPDLTFYVLGRDLEGIHFVRRVLLPISSIYLFLLLAEKKKNNLNIFYIFIIILAFTFGAATQIKSIRYHLQYYKRSEDETNLINFLNKKISSNQVIASFDPSINLLLPAVTSHYVYLPMSNMTLSSPEEEVERTIILASIMGLNTTDISNMFLCQKIKNCYSLGMPTYYFIWSEKNSDEKKMLVDKITSRMKKYNLTERKKNKYKMNYILVTDYNLPVNFKLKTEKLIYKTGKYYLYSIHSL